MWTTTDVKNQLLSKFKDHSAVIGVIGLGYVGLPFAIEQAKAGFRVVGIELNSDRVAKVNRGESFIPDVPSPELKHWVDLERIRAVDSFEKCPDVDVLVICVPTNLTRNYTPDLQYVESASRGILKVLRRGQLISLESTTYPGTTEEVVVPILESSGLKVESDFFVAHSPERVDPGNARYQTHNTPKLVGAVGPHSHQVAVDFYAQSLERVVPVVDAKTAEMAKVFENTFRAVNIALVNEMTMLCDRMNVDVWKVLDAAYTKPFGILPFYPGPGVGGHCIPIDPHYLEWKAKEFHFETRFISLAGEINRNMPGFVRDKVANVLNNAGKCLAQSRITILGVSYKPNSNDYRESPSMEVIRLLRRSGAKLVYHDPFVPLIRERDFQMEGQPLTAQLCKESDLTLILTAHRGIDYAWVAQNSARVVDTRNATANVLERTNITLL